jgi:AraC-like DNA-binding protein
MNPIHKSFPGIAIAYDLTPTPLPQNFHMHTHILFEIYCFLRGKGIYHVEGSKYNLQSGDVLLMRPGEAHFFEPDSRYPYERITLHVDSSIFSSIDPENSLMQPLFNRTAGKLNLYRASAFHSSSYMTYIKSTLLSSANRISVFANLILLMQELGNLFNEKSLTEEPDTVEYQLINYINHNLDTQLSIQMLCDHFYISRTQLCRIFKNATGTSVGKYIRTKRLLSARELIVQGQKPTEVFRIYGYQDYTTFYRSYINYFGRPPRDDKQEYNEAERYEIK